MHTPWGKSDHSTRHERGIIFYSTPSHGGFHISKTKLASMPEALRNREGWYEEDCEAAKVLLAFPHLFPADKVASAKDSLRNWQPEAYERFYGVTLQPGESHVRDEQIFKQVHANDWIVVSASGDWHAKAKPGFCYTVASPGGSYKPGRAERAFLVPSAEYAARGPHGFVIDPARHEEIAA